MIHKYKQLGLNIVMDVYSGAVLLSRLWQRQNVPIILKKV